MTTVEEFEMRLMALDHEAIDFCLKVDELVASVSDDRHQALIPVIFRFFEIHPLNDVGTPGTLIHLTEHFYPAYKPHLFRSLEVRPSINTILMANRILNSKLSDEERREYLRALEAVASNNDFANELRDSAKHFIEYQNDRS